MDEDLLKKQMAEIDRHMEARLRATMNADTLREWKSDMVTKHIIALMRDRAEEARAQWISQSWEGGRANELDLAALRARADALTEFFNVDLKDFYEDA